MYIYYNATLIAAASVMFCVCYTGTIISQERAAALQEALALSKLRQEQQKQAENKALSEEEYSDLLQHLKDSDAQFTELSLEEVIYQLAKLLFSQNLSTGGFKIQILPNHCLLKQFIFYC
jgi:hypothetical protein